jgi:hypothetical protein
MSSKRADSNVVMTFAPFFHSEAEPDLVSQVAWAEDELGLSDAFFSRLLEVDEGTFSDWRLGTGAISKDKRDDLGEFWDVVRHMLSFLNHNIGLLHIMLDYVDDSNNGAVRLPFSPPWIGTSLRTYLERTGSEGVQAVSHWVQALRFADSY